MEKTKAIIESLDNFGFTGEDNFDKSNFNIESLTKVRCVIKDNLQPTKSFPKPEGYVRDKQLRNLVLTYLSTNDSKFYVTTGLFIYAMYLEGYMIRQVSYRNKGRLIKDKSVYFNVSLRSIRNFIKKYNLEHR